MVVCDKLGLMVAMILETSVCVKPRLIRVVLNSVTKRSISSNMADAVSDASVEEVAQEVAEVVVEAAQFVSSISQCL